MKRRVICFITSLALCLGLCPTWALAASQNITLKGDMSQGETYTITSPAVFEGAGYTYTVSSGTAMVVKSGGSLELRNGTVKSEKGAGVKVENGGSLTVNAPSEGARSVTVIGSTYGLDISSGATITLSDGTYTATNSDGKAIQADNYASLLKSGYAYFNGNSAIPLFNADGSQITTGVAGQKTVQVKKCTDHKYSYTAIGDTPTHNGICDYCGTEVTSVPCTFTFDDDGHGECVYCEHTIEIDITVDGSLIYDGMDKAGLVKVKVTLDGIEDKPLANGDDKDYVYTVDPSPIIDVDGFTVIVKGNSFEINTCDGTYRKTLYVTRARPQITWADTAASACGKDYDGNPIDKAALLQQVLITNICDGDLDELRSSVQFSYERNGDAVADAEITDGSLPTDAGTYNIIAKLPGTQNYKEAVSDPITLTINKINPIIEAPKAIANLVYNRSAQNLVTGGTAWDGAVILFALRGGSYSEAIPTGTDAAEYTVYYKVEETNNYIAVPGTKITVKIQRKEITPDVLLEYTSCVYDGGEKEPTVTVIDTDDDRVLPSTEYKVHYDNNKNVGTATVTVTDNDGGNYAIIPPEGITVTFKITPADQDGLNITGQRSKVTYGDVFTLGTTGGSGNGTVAWEITTGKDTVATVDSGGQVTVTGVGAVTVRATKSGINNDGNHTDATAEWTFTAEPKRVTATVTAKDKTYDGTATAMVEAEVKEGVVSGDTIKIEGLTGTFRDGPGAGTNKTVTVDTSKAEITLNEDEKITNSSNATDEKYIVTIPGTTTADITKAATKTEKTSVINTELIYKEGGQPLLTAGSIKAVTDVDADDAERLAVEYALSKDGNYTTAIPEATNAGSYTVWYRVKETANYFGTTAESVVVKIGPKKVSPDVKLSQDKYAYDGRAKEPAVTVTYQETGENNTDKTITIPSTEYTVTYSNNTNAGKAKTAAEDETEIKFDANAPAVTVTAKEGGNYQFDNVQMNFEITTGDSAVLTSSPQARNLTYNGQAQELVTVGTATGGHLVYAWKENNGEPAEADYTTSIPKGTNAGEYTVYYKVKGDGNHEDSDVFSVSVTIQPKTVTSPVIEFKIPVTAENTEGPEDEEGTGTAGVEYKDTYSVVYTGGKQEPEVRVMDGNETIPMTEYTVTYSNNTNAGAATVHINDKNGGNYNVSGSITFEIKKAKAEFSTEPESASGLVYNGKAQPLLKTAGVAGVPEGGMVVYSLDGGEYSSAVPTATSRGQHTILAKVRGDANHEDSKVITLKPLIAVNSVTNPTVELSSTMFRYNGSEQKPTVTVKDDDGNVIAASEYTVTYEKVTDKNAPEESAEAETVKPVDPGRYYVVVTSKKINYTEFEKKVEFEITEADQTAITITGTRAEVFYGDKIQLGITGGTGDGRVTWKIEKVRKTGTDETSVDPSISNMITADGGLLTVSEITEEGESFIVTATRTSTSGSYKDATATWTFTVQKKPIKATLTGNNKTYDRTNTATVMAEVDPSGLVSGDSIIIEDLIGEFESSDVGTKMIRNITADRSVENPVSGTNWEKYDIIYPTTATADITPKTITPTVTVAQTPYTYDGTAKEPSVTVTYPDGDQTVTLQPDTDYTVAYSNNINAGTATVTVKNVDGGNYIIISDPKNFTIDKANVDKDKVIEPTGKTLMYNGTKQALIVAGDSPDGKMEYKLDNGDYSEDIPTAIAAGTYYISYRVVGDSNHNNYECTENEKVTVKIAKAEQAQLTITGIPSVIYKGDRFEPIISGGSENGTVTWDVDNGGAAEKDPDNSNYVKVTGVGEFTITAIKAGSDNYEAKSATWTFTANPAQLTQEELEKIGITVTAKTLTYNGEAQPLIDVKNTSETVTLEYSLDGSDYQPDIPQQTDAGTYTVWYKVQDDNDRVGCITVTIAKAKPILSATATSIYKGQSLGDSQITGSASYSGENVPGTFAWKAPSTLPILTASWGATFTPNDQDNFEKVDISIRVEVLDPPSTNSSGTGTSGTGTSGSAANGTTSTDTNTAPNTESASTQTSVQNGASSTVMNSAAGDELVNEAVANGSESVVIKPEITGDVTKTEVSIPASAVGRIGSETNAALTVSTPVADVTIPNESLGTLSGAGGTVSVVTEQVDDNTVVLTLTAGGKDVESVPGGLTLTVPVEDAGPGTVAVLVYEDGTRETIRWSVVDGDGIRIPLDGSATVEIVDNSKEFTDVPADSWAAGTVAFASAHEMFNGTGKATFSPELSMSRAMLATVLYNLDGHSDQSLTDGFSDVDSSTWYAEGVSWAAANGIVSGYGNGQFGPDDSITREQIAVMLWRYAGSPEADEQILNFVDADQVSGYAKDAIYWAAANGILNGYGDGHLDPAGLATRAQAAQMLRNFIENT